MELDAVSQIASGARNPTQELEASESRDELFSALDLLPERDRSIITLCYISQLSQREIAVFLGEPVSNINNRLYVSRRRLKDCRRVVPQRDEMFATRIEERVRCKARPSPSTSRWSQRRGVSSLICHRNWLSP